MKKAIHQYFILALLFAISGCLNGCNDILETDISDRSVELLAPADEANITAGELSFWWSNVDDATSYQFQIVRPDFNSPQELVMDSSMAVNSINLELSAGNYQWRVCAANSSYQTPFSTRSLTVLGENDLTNTEVTLIAPADSIETSSTAITFGWERIEKADSYLIQIVKPNFDQPETLITSEETTDNSFALTLSAGQYQWRVKAVNDASSTEYSTRSLTILP